MAKTVELNLIETETIWLLDMPGICVSMEGDEAPQVQEQIQRYNEVRKKAQYSSLS